MVLTQGLYFLVNHFVNLLTVAINVLRYRDWMMADVYSKVTIIPKGLVDP